MQTVVYNNPLYYLVLLSVVYSIYIIIKLLSYYYYFIIIFFPHEGMGLYVYILVQITRISSSSSSYRFLYNSYLSHVNHTYTTVKGRRYWLLENTKELIPNFPQSGRDTREMGIPSNRVCINSNTNTIISCIIKLLVYIRI